MVPTGKSVYHIVLAFLSTLSHGITIAFGVKTDISIKLKCEFAARRLTQNQFFLAGRHFFFLKIMISITQQTRPHQQSEGT